MKKAFLGFSVIAGLVGLTGVATADNLGQINFEGTSVGTFTNIGFLGLSSLQFVPNVGSTIDFYAYCTDRTTEAAPPFNWDVDQLTTASFQSVNPSTLQSTLNAREGEEIAYIVNNWGNTADATQATEVQLAVWDIAEGGTGLVNSDTGADLVLTSAGSISGAYWGTGTAGGSFGGASLSTLQIVTQAGSYAAAAYAQGASGGASSLYYEAQRETDGQPVSQDFVPPTPSPEPVTLGLGVAGVAMAVRRRFARR